MQCASTVCVADIAPRCRDSFVSAVKPEVQPPLDTTKSIGFSCLLKVSAVRDRADALVAGLLANEGLGSISALPPVHSWQSSQILLSSCKISLQ